MLGLEERKSGFLQQLREQRGKGEEAKLGGEARADGCLVGTLGSLAFISVQCKILKHFNQENEI